VAADLQSISHASESIVLVGVLTVSDRASAGRYEDRGGPAVVAHLERRLAPGWRAERRVVADDIDAIAAALADLVALPCALVVTTGGTGVGPRDVTPEATLRVCERVIPGFGEAMRADSRHETPLAILSRAEAGVAGRALVLNLPGSPRAVATCLDAALPAVPHALAQIGAPPLALRETDPRAQDAHGG
jgi:molybdopterin adenylyltransferase